MKSSRNVHSASSEVKFEAWLPAEDNLTQVSSILEARQQEYRAIFQDQAEAGSTKKPKAASSRLHLAGTNQEFSSWQFGEMDEPTVVIRKPEWTFIEEIDEPVGFPEEPEQPVLAEILEPAPDEPSAIEIENAMLLEQARIQAEEIILAAQAEADKILSQVEEEIEEQKKVAYQESWDKACLEIEDTLKATHLVVDEVNTWKNDLVTQGEQILVEMLKQIAQKMFGEGVELDTNALQVNLNHIMENAHGLGNLNIFLNPRDAKNLDQSWSEYQMLVSGDNVKIIPSGKITRGGCFVKGDMGVVDGRVETQMAAILKTFSDPSELAE